MASLDLEQAFWTMLGGDPHELLAVRVTAVFFVKTTRRVARPGDHERSGFGTIK